MIASEATKWRKCELYFYLSEGWFSRSLLFSSAMMETLLLTSVLVWELIEDLGLAGASVGFGSWCRAFSSSLFCRSLRSNGYSLMAVIRMLVLRTWKFQMKITIVVLYWTLLQTFVNLFICLLRYFTNNFFQLVNLD